MSHRRKKSPVTNCSYFVIFSGTALLLTLVFITAAEAAATVFRCTSLDGRIEFSQRPCGSGDQKKLLIKDRKVGWDAPKVALKSERTPRIAQRQKSKRRKFARSARLRKKRQEKDCWKKEQKVKKIQWRMRRGYKAGKGVELRRRRREYEAYLKKFCK